jgi:RNA polymerase sigma factor (sigma-70 family)
LWGRRGGRDDARELPDVQVIARSRKDPEVFVLLVDRHSAALHAYLARRLEDCADDLLSEVWLVAFSRRCEFDPARGDVRPWLFGIARKLLLAHWRQQRTRLDLVARLGGYREAEESGWDAVDARLDAAALRPDLLQAVKDLPESERELLLLTACDGLTPTEAAEMLGIPAGTARSRLHRARSRVLADLDGRLANSRSTSSAR